MRASMRRKLTSELWRVRERLRLACETEESLARLTLRLQALTEKLGGERPWGLRSPTASTDGCIGGSSKDSPSAVMDVFASRSEMTCLVDSRAACTATPNHLERGLP
jgi:hypothetical protein